MSDGGWIAAFSAVAIALIAAIRECLMLYIRARHRWKNGHSSDTDGTNTPVH